MLQYVICDDERQYLDAMLSALKVEGESEQHIALVTSDPNAVLNLRTAGRYVEAQVLAQ